MTLTRREHKWTAHADARWKQRSLPGEDRDLLVRHARRPGIKVSRRIRKQCPGHFKECCFSPYHERYHLYNGGWVFVVDHDLNIVTCFHLHREPKP
jgi:hypothetical protein